MKLTGAEKLILMMLVDLHKKLAIKGEIDPEFVQSAILSDNLWGFDWKYHGTFSAGDEETPAAVRQVCDYLDMWTIIERSWSKFSKDEKAKIGDAAEPFGTDVEFPGFDGNNEGEYLSIAKFLVDELDSYSDFKGRGDLNSHSQSIETYARMHAVFERLRPSISQGVMTADQIIEVLKAKRYPGAST